MPKNPQPVPQRLRRFEVVERAATLHSVLTKTATWRPRPVRLLSRPTSRPSAARSGRFLHSRPGSRFSVGSLKKAAKPVGTTHRKYGAASVWCWPICRCCRAQRCFAFKLCFPLPFREGSRGRVLSGFVQRRCLEVPALAMDSARPPQSLRGSFPWEGERVLGAGW